MLDVESILFSRTLWFHAMEIEPNNSKSFTTFDLYHTKVCDCAGFARSKTVPEIFGLLILMNFHCSLMVTQIHIYIFIPFENCILLRISVNLASIWHCYHADAAQQHLRRSHHAGCGNCLVLRDPLVSCNEVRTKQ